MGKYRDLSNDWFASIGPKLVSTAFILSIGPIIDWISVDIVYRYGKRNDKLEENFHTKSKTFSQYKQIH